MTPVRVFFLDNEVLIDTVPTPFVAGSLVATISNDAIEIRRVESDFLFTAIPWSAVAARDGSTFASPDDVMTYLQGEFSKRRPVGDTFGTAMVAGEDLPIGMPVAVSRSTGQLLLARADTLTLSFVAGLVTTETSQGFTTTPARGAVTLSDWTEQTGRSSLFAGAPYFLGAEGGLTISPFVSPGMTSTQVGIAASTTILIVNPTTPILL